MQGIIAQYQDDRDDISMNETVSDELKTPAANKVTTINGSTILR